MVTNQFMRVDLPALQLIAKWTLSLRRQPPSRSPLVSFQRCDFDFSPLFLLFNFKLHYLMDLLPPSV
ncbi:hypothetical protein RJT34_00949 [Clitoria ternatea]|uniref:Uncharacterized protein n=1 Tax=Clitoria ternatea TaxID=43366 RepID=A0AAN9PYB0_CLITE